VVVAVATQQAVIAVDQAVVFKLVALGKFRELEHLDKVIMAELPLLAQMDLVAAVLEQ
jgi:hypothetical protein